MKKILFVFSIYFLLSPLNIFSQYVVSNDTFDKVYFNKITKGNNNNISDYSSIDGSPYLVDDFLDSKIYFSKDSVFEIKLRYNIYDNTMEFKHNKVVFSFTNPEIIYKIDLSGNNFIYYYDKNKNKNSSYFQVLAEGKCYLLAKKRVKYEQEGKGDGIIDAKPAHFANLKDEYFLSIKGNVPVRIKNKKTLIKTLNNKSSEISKFIKKEKISHKNIDDLIKLVKFYNSLD